MGFFDIDLDSGDPEVRKWFLVESKTLPLMLCVTYVFAVKIWGPKYMKDRPALDLRKTMLAYNICIVVFYAWFITVIVSNFIQMDKAYFCRNSELFEGISLKLVSYGWSCYIIKYIEFMDTVFFLLRKRFDLISNLHVIHHSIIPMVGWIGFRTERTLFQLLPCLLNCVVHVIMYSYYALAAMGPNIRKYLWWKKYLTMLQMTQFVMIFLYAAIITPLSGCSTSNSLIQLSLTLTVLFFGLFYNYYRQSFKKSESKNIHATTTKKVH